MWWTRILSADQTAIPRSSFFGLRPKHPGATIPSVAFSTFDPTSERFTEISTAPVAITVTGSSATIAGGDLVGAIAAPTNTKEIKTCSEGIFHNVTDASQVFDERIDLFGGLRWVAGLWLGLGIASATVIAFRRKDSDIGRQRKATARRRAHARLSTAKSLLSHGNEKASLSEVRASILGYFADARNRIAEGMTSADVLEVMREAAVPSELQKRLQSLLERIESAEYGANLSGDSKSLLKEASEVVDKVGPYLERRSLR